MAKRAWRYRCMAVTNGRRCWTRRSFPRPLEEYARPPKCPRCGSRRHWYYDAYRTEVELRRTRCKCAGGPYPHRRGSSASGGRFGAWECVYFCPF